MADIILTSGENPPDFHALNGASVTIQNGVTDSEDQPVSTTLDCDPGLFTPANAFPMTLDPGEVLAVQVNTSGKSYSYTDPTELSEGTRAGRINP